MEEGDIVKSIKGRDSGKIYVVVKIIDKDFVELCNGDSRKITNPKIKRIKHCVAVGQFPNFESNSTDASIKKICKSFILGGKNA